MLLGPVIAAVSLSLADTSTASVRSMPSGDDVALDLTTSPSTALVVALPRSQLALGYSPSFSWIDVTRDVELVVLHGANITYSWWKPRLRLALSATGSLGRQTFVSAARGAPRPGSNDPALPTAPTSAVNFVPQQEVVYTGALGVSLGMSYILSRRWDLGVGLTYELGGGLGDSERFVPMRRGPTASAALAHKLTRRDTLTTSLQASLTDVPERGSRFYTIGAMELWSHRFAVRTVGSVGAGVVYLQARETKTSANERSLLAAGSANISQGYALESGADLNLTAGATLGTGYNPVLGVVDQSVSGVTSVGWSLHRTALGANAQVSQTLPVSSPRAALGFGAGANASYRLATPVQLQAGAFWSRQVLPNQVVVSGFSPDSWSAFVGVTLVAPALAF